MSQRGSRASRPIYGTGSRPPIISVVIPTIGRATLRAAIDSVLRQSMVPDEIVVVNDSPSQSSVTSMLAVEVVEEFTGGSRGPSAARNQGVARAQGDYIAYLDDDDLWFPHHIESAMQSFARSPNLDLYSCTMIQPHTNGLEISSKVTYQGRQALVDFFYGRYCWAGRRRSIPPSTWVFRRTTCDLPMDEGLFVREDIWELIKLHQRGRVLFQSARCGAAWFSDPARTLARDTPETLLDWAHRLEGITKGAGTRFLVGVVGRLYARQGMADEWTDLIGRVPRDWKISWDYQLVCTVEGVVATATRRLAPCRRFSALRRGLH
jgi:glycosyltransferase involved in cell wall biosynthesis